MKIDISDVNKEWTKSESWIYNFDIQETINILDFLWGDKGCGGIDCVEEYCNIISTADALSRYMR